MQRRIIPSQDHPSNLDPTARLVASRLGEKWDVFSVVGGFMAGAVLPGPRCVALEGLFDTLDEARDAAIALVRDAA